MYHLPPELQGLIYEFDNTYREQFKKVLEEIEDQDGPDYLFWSLKNYYDDKYSYYNYENEYPDLIPLTANSWIAPDLLNLTPDELQEYISYEEEEDIMPSPPTNFVQVDPDDILDFLFRHGYAS